MATAGNGYDFGVFPGNGDGTFGPGSASPWAMATTNYFVKAADVNGDGWPDLVFGGNDHLTVATNRADGTFAFDPVRRHWGDTYGVAAGDLNGDGRPELVVTDHDDNLLRVLDGNARRRWPPTIRPPASATATAGAS